MMVYIDKRQLSLTIIWIIEMTFLIIFLPLFILLLQSGFAQQTAIIWIALLLLFVFIGFIYFIACILHFRISNRIIHKNGIKNTRYYTESIIKNWQHIELFTRNLDKHTKKIAENQYYYCKYMNHINPASYTKPHSKKIDLYFYTMCYETYMCFGEKPAGYHILICNEQPLNVMQSDESINGIIYEEHDKIKAVLEISQSDFFKDNDIAMSFKMIQKAFHFDRYILLFGDNDFISYFLENVANNAILYK